MKRSSNSRVWNWARTRMAKSSSEPPRRWCALDLLADAARFLGAVPDADDADLLAVAGVGPQRLAEPAGVVGDEAVGGGEDVAGRAVILLEPDDLRAGEILFEAQDVGDLGAAPANRSTGRRRRRSTGCGAARRAASATRTGAWLVS